LIRENATPGSIARQSIKTPREASAVKSFIDDFESAEKDVAANNEITNPNVSRLVRYGSIDLENISRILQALKDKYEESPLIVLSKQFNNLLDAFTQDPDQYDRLSKFVTETLYPDDSYEPVITNLAEFRDRIVYSDKEELLDSLEAVMLNEEIRSEPFDKLIKLLPNITRTLILSDRENRADIKTEYTYTVAPLVRFTDVLKGNKTTLEKFNDLFRYLVNENWLKDNIYKFYTGGVRQGEFDVRSPMYTLFKILKFTEREDIFSDPAMGAVMGRREQLTSRRPTLFRLFITEYLSGKISGVTKEEADDYNRLSYEDKTTREDEEIERITLPKTAANSLKPNYDEWLVNHRAFMGEYAKTEKSFEQLYRNTFQGDIDKGSIFSLCIPRKENEGTVELTNFLTDDSWPSNISEADAKIILKAYLRIIEDFSKLGFSNIDTNKLLQNLRNITSDIRELEYTVTRRGETETRKLFTYNKDTGNLNPPTARSLDNIKGMENINKLIEAFITDFKQALDETSEAICKSIHSAVVDNIDKRSIKRYNILVRREKKLDKRGKQMKDTSGNVEYISRKEGTIQEWIQDFGGKDEPLITARRE